MIQRNVFGTVYEMAQIPVPKRLISAGDIIAADDLEWQPVHLTRLSGNSLTDAEQLVGRMAKRPLKAGQILRQSDVAMSPVIHKNDLIRLVVQTGQMTLSVQGKALQDAALGQTVRVVNVNSNRQLSGTVIDAGTVAVGFDVPRRSTEENQPCPGNICAVAATVGLSLSVVGCGNTLERIARVGEEPPLSPIENPTGPRALPAGQPADAGRR